MEVPPTVRFDRARSIAHRHPEVVASACQRTPTRTINVGPPTLQTDTASVHLRAAPRCCVGVDRNDHALPSWRRKETNMQHHLGRLIDHVHLRVSDVEASKRFYRSVFEALNLPDILVEGDGYFHADE